MTAYPQLKFKIFSVTLNRGRRLTKFTSSTQNTNGIIIFFILINQLTHFKAGIYPSNFDARYAAQKINLPIEFS